MKYRNYQIYWILLLYLHHHRFSRKFFTFRSERLPIRRYCILQIIYIYIFLAKRRASYPRPQPHRLATIYIVHPQFSASVAVQLSAKNGRYQYPHRNVKIRQMSPIWFIIRRTHQKCDIWYDYPTFYKHCIPPAGNTQGPFRECRVRERSYSTAIEWSNSRTKERCEHPL